MGSVSARQDFSRSDAELPYRFQGRASAPLMTDDGWGAEGLLVNLEAEKADGSPSGLLAIISICIMNADEQRFGNAACAADTKD